MNDLISIIVPVYNAEKWLRRCIDSIRFQDYHLIEIVLIDDGSSDSSGAICNEYAEIDNRIKYIKQENSGVASARNKGIKHATGKYIIFCDSDDWLERNAVSKLYFSVEKFKVDYVIPRWRGNYYTVDGKFVKYVYDEDDVTLILNKSELMTNFDYLFEHNSCFSTCGRLYRKSFLELYCIEFDHRLKILEDFCFNLKCMRSGSGVHTQDIVYNYSIYGIENYIYRRDYTVLKESIPIVFKEFDEFITNMNMIQKPDYYDFIMSYWIIAIKNILVSEKSLLFKVRKIHEIISFVNEERLLSKCSKGKIKREYWLLFRTKSIMIFHLIQCIRKLKNTIVNRINIK